MVSRKLIDTLTSQWKEAPFILVPYLFILPATEIPITRIASIGKAWGKIVGLVYRDQPDWIIPRNITTIMQK